MLQTRSQDRQRISTKHTMVTLITTTISPTPTTRPKYGVTRRIPHRTINRHISNTKERVTPHTLITSTARIRTYSRIHLHTHTITLRPNHQPSRLQRRRRSPQRTPPKRHDSPHARLNRRRQAKGLIIHRQQVATMNQRRRFNLKLTQSRTLTMTSQAQTVTNISIRTMLTQQRQLTLTVTRTGTPTALMMTNRMKGHIQLHKRQVRVNLRLLTQRRHISTNQMPSRVRITHNRITSPPPIQHLSPHLTGPPLIQSSPIRHPKTAHRLSRIRTQRSLTSHTRHHPRSLAKSTSQRKPRLTYRIIRLTTSQLSISRLARQQTTERNYQVPKSHQDQRKPIYQDSTPTDQ